MNKQAERRVGSVIGAKWRVDALLGSGSMAAVYAVTHRNGARAALKILHPTLCTDPAVCERFLGEGYLTNSVKHSGIVRVLDDGVTDDGCVFLVMDLLEGDTLEALRQRRGGRIDLVELLDITDKLMDVLHAVHTAGIIHRDLKPQNVFVCHDKEVKLLDFGVARVFDRASHSKLSMFGLVLGTPSFMSPEQALGSRDKVDHRSDIWSLGATMFTALTGETVHLGANVQAKLLAAATVKARSITMVMPDLPTAIASHIDTALRFKKEDRWQSVDAFRRALREARVQLGLGKPQSVLPPGFEDSHLDDTNPDLAPPSGMAPPAAPSDARPSGRGPGGTFIGIGMAHKAKAIVGNDGSFQPPRPPAPSVPSAPPPAPRPPMGSVPPGPMRPPMGSVPPVPSQPPPLPIRPPVRALDLRDGSIPAYGADDTGANVAAMGVRKRGTVAVWIAAFVLAAAALGGIVFFAARGGPDATRDPAEPSVDMPATTSSAAPGSALPPPAATTIVPTPPPSPATTPNDNRAGTKDGDPNPVRPAVAAAPPHPRSGGHTMRSSTPIRPPSTAGSDPPATTATTATAEPKPAPTLAPDPFGTPE